MIIASSELLEIGEIRHGGLTDSKGNIQNNSFQVLRIATKDEYLEYCKLNGCSVPSIYGVVGHYEVSTD